MITIYKEKIKAGKNKLVNIPISKLPSGTQINLEAHVFNGGKEGSTILFAGGLHGDEINGIEIVRKAIELKLFDNLKRGTVIAIPVINTLGFINCDRDASGKDVNRSFPGSKLGSLASLISHAITHEILPVIDFGIDFHTGGASIHNSPQLRVSMEDDNAIEIAKQTAVPILIKKSTIAKSFRKQALLKGKSILVFEGGESLRLDTESIDCGVKAIINLLISNQMIEGGLAINEQTIFDYSRWQRSSKAGIFTAHKKAGQKVDKGEIIGEINHLNPFSKTKVKSKYSGTLIGRRNNPVVNKGDALFHIAIKEK